MHLINGTRIKNPSNFSIDRFNVTTLERLANADMAGDLLAKKIKLSYQYDYISGYDLDVILEAIWNTEDIFFNLTYTENGVQKVVNVYTGNIPTTLYRAGKTDNWVWKDVNISFIQR